MLSALERFETLPESALLDFHLAAKKGYLIFKRQTAKLPVFDEGCYMTGCTVLADVRHNMNDQPPL